MNILSVLLFILGLVALIYGVSIASLLWIIVGVVILVVGGVPHVGRLRR